MPLDALSPENRFDVLVVGGGTAGTIAAIQAGRLGARTLLVEAGSQLGGVTTTGGVNFPGLFHAWGRPVIAGIGWELILATTALASGTLPDFSQIPPRHWHHQIRLNAPTYALLAEEACVTAGVELAYYAFPTAVTAADAGGYHLTVQGKGLVRRIHCRQIVDATGGAEVVALLGLPRLREKEIQPGTQMYRIDGYDPATLDAEAIQARYRAALAEGQLQPGDFATRNGLFISVLRSHGENTQHIFEADASTSATHTETNLRGRASVLRLLRFIRSLPGCEQAALTWMSPETAVRETYRIEGETTITCEDYLAGRVYPDAVCHSFYPIDLHTHEGVKPQPLAEGVVPTVPLGALIPRGSRSLLVAGRCVASDRLANSALRVQATCMAMGQAAGAAAALAARSGAQATAVPIAALRQALREHGAIVPEPV